MALNGGEIISYLSLDTSKYSSAMQAALSELGVFADRSATGAQRAQAFGSALTTVGTRLTMGVTVPIVGAGAAVGKAAIEYESAFAGVRKTVDATEAEFAALSDTILRMSTDTPVAATELAAIMESAGQLGVKTQNLEKFTKTMADLAVATNLTSEEAAAMLAQYANVTGMDLNSIDRLGSVIVALGNNTATTERDITEMAQRLSGAANVIGLTDAQVMGLAATMTSLGINAEMGGSAMSRIMQKAQEAVASGGGAIKSWAAAAKVSADEFSAAWKADPIQALRMLLNGLKTVQDAGGNVYAVLQKLGLKDVRITDTLLRLLGAQEGLAENIQLANDAWEQNSALTKEAEQRYATTESQLQLTKNSIQRLAVSLGNSLLPYIRRGADFIANLADRFAQLDEATQKNILTWAAVIAAIGPATTLLGGLLKLLSGPAGILVAAGLAAGAIYSLIAASNQQNEAAALKDLETRFGNIELSAEQIQAILASNLGSVTIDTTKLEAAKGDMQAAQEKVTELSTSLATDIMLVKLGADTGEIDALPGKAENLIKQTQSLLASEENACILTVKTQFGENSEAGNSIIGDLNSYFSGLNTKFADKGKELRQALDRAIADGKIDDEEEKTIARLQNELMEIASRGAMIESQTAQDMFLFKAKNRGLSADSIRELSKELDAYRATENEKAEQLYYDTAQILFNLKNAGEFKGRESEYENLMAENEKKWGEHSGRIEREAFDLAWRAFGQQIVSSYAPDMKGLADFAATQRDGINPQDVYGYVYSKDRNQDITAAKSARIMLDESKWLMDGLTNLEKTMGSHMPEQYRDMLTQMRQLEQWTASMEALEQVRSHNVPGVRSDEEEVVWWLSKYFPQTPIEAKVPVEVEPQYQPTDDEEEISAAAIGIPETPIEAEVPVEVEPRYQPADDEEEISAAAIGIPQTPVEAEVPVTLKADIENGSKEAEDAGASLSKAGAEGAESQRSAYADAGANAAAAFANAVSARESVTYGAGAGLGENLLNSLKRILKIHSPSRAAEEIGLFFDAGLTQGIEAGSSGTANAARRLADNVLNGMKRTASQVGDFLGIQKSAYDQGYIQGFTSDVDKEKKPAEADPKTAKKKQPSGSTDSGRREMQEQQALLDAILAKRDAAYERMMALIGPSSIWYQESPLDQALKDLNAKYDALIAAAKSGGDAYKEQLKKNQQAEEDAIKREYQVQQQIAIDFLSEREQTMQQQLSERQEAARLEDYEKNIASLEKRIRQTKSARERRELKEELDAMIRDEELRRAQEELSNASSGFAILKNAVKSGIIGLGDLIADPSLGDMAWGSGGLTAIPDISAAQLEAVLKAMGDGYTGGNTYQIDLTGAVLRDENDIQRIVDEFEDRMREIQRGL